jgi:hypothetical protein
MRININLCGYTWYYIIILIISLLLALYRDIIKGHPISWSKAINNIVYAIVIIIFTQILCNVGLSWLALILMYLSIFYPYSFIIPKPVDLNE